MSSMVGADLEQVRALAASFDRAAAQLNQTSTTVRKGIQISAWAGPFAIRFRHTWDSEHSVKLRQAASALSEQARQLRQEADQQESASSAATATRPGTGPVTDRDLIDFAQSGTSNKAGISKNGYTALTDADLRDLGIDPAMLHDSHTGFDAKVYRDTSGRIIVAFGGTEPSQAGDLRSDGVGASHFDLTEQAEKSVQLALELKNSVGAENLVFTGHSLGGRNAALASVATGARAVTFNAAGVSSGDYLFASTAGGKSVGLVQYVMGATGAPLSAPHVTNYATSTDPLTIIQGSTPLPDAIGEHHYVHSDEVGLASHSDFDGFRREVSGD